MSRLRSQSSSDVPGVRGRDARRARRRRPSAIRQSRSCPNRRAG